MVSCELEGEVVELNAALSDKDQAMKLECDTLQHDVSKLQTRLGQMELDREQVVTEKSALTDKVFILFSDVTFVSVLYVPVSCMATEIENCTIIGMTGTSRCLR